MNRRTFTFASLATFAAAAASTAQASDPDANRPTTLEGRWTGKVKEGVFTLILAVHNCGTTDLSVLLARGSQPGADVTASLATEGPPIALAEVARQVDVRELVSRMGPMPRYAVLAAAQDVEIGAYAFTLPSGADHEPITATATVYVDSDSVVLTHRFDPADVPRG